MPRLSTKRQSTAWLAAGLLAATLGGCGKYSLNEGVTHVRYQAREGSFQGIYHQPTGATAEIRSGEAYSINLLSGFVCDFRESKRFGEGKFVDSIERSNPDAQPCGGGLNAADPASGTTRGEIAIVMRAGERSQDHDLSFDYGDIQKRGVLVYYDEDVRESGQLLNFRNIPIHGPAVYQGRPAFLELHLLEMDIVEGSAVNDLLQTLAAIGGASGSFGKPVQDLLVTLGSSLVNGASNDIEQRFHLVFDAPAPAESTLPRSHLREGYYAVVREERRDLETGFEAFCVDEANGLLRTGATDARGSCNDRLPLYQQRTWFLLKVQREQAGAVLDGLTRDTLEAFEAKVREFQGRGYRQNIQPAFDRLQSTLQCLQQMRDTSTSAQVPTECLR